MAKEKIDRKELEYIAGKISEELGDNYNEVRVSKNGSIYFLLDYVDEQSRLTSGATLEEIFDITKKYGLVKYPSFRRVNNVSAIVSFVPKSSNNMMKLQRIGEQATQMMNQARQEKDSPSRHTKYAEAMAPVIEAEREICSDYISKGHDLTEWENNVYHHLLTNLKQALDRDFHGGKE